MQQALGDFIQALRHHGLPISTAETLDALKAAQWVGMDSPELLKSALGMTLAKTLPHRMQLETLFDQFFQAHQRFETEDAAAGDSQPPAEGSLPQAEGSQPTAEGSLPPAEGSPPQPEGSAVASPLAQQLLSNDQASLQTAIVAAAQAANANQMQMFTQKGPVSYRIMKQLGDQQLSQELTQLAQEDSQSMLVELLQHRRQQLLEQVKDYVEQQYLLFSQHKGQQLREQNLQKIKLTNIDHSAYRQMTRLVQKAAKQLASLHSRRRRVTKRGLLDVRKTLAANAAYDGYLFHTRWKSTRVDRPKVMVLCDVSGSCSRVARFLLLFLYSLQDVLPRVRSFVFASSLGEVTQLFQQHDIEQALAQIMSDWANRPTDYGRALTDFAELALNDIDNKTTVIMLGDARNNHSDGKAELWQKVYQRSQRVLWLNPESRYSWNSGDSIMNEYAPYCSLVDSCNSLRDLNRILGSLLKYS